MAGYRWMRAGCLAGVAALLLGGGGCCRLPVESDPQVESYLPVARTEIGGPANATSASNAVLTVDACVRIALDVNPACQAVREGLRGLDEAVQGARSSYYPQVTLNAAYSRWEMPAFLPAGLGPPGTGALSIGPMNDWSGSARARWLLFDTGERVARLRAALANRRAVASDVERVRQDMALNVHRAFYTLAMALDGRTVAGENLKRAEDHKRLASDRASAGAVPPVDVARSEVEVANGRLACVRADSLVRTARATLNTAMGLPAALQMVEIAPGESALAPDATALNAAVDWAAHARPEILAALQRVAAARQAVAAARSGFGPRLSAEGKYGWRDDRFLPERNDWLAGVALEVPLFSGFSTVHDVERLKAELGRAEAETRGLVLAVEREVVAAQSHKAEAVAAADAAEALVRSAAETMRLADERYRAGAGTTADFFDAQVALDRAKFEVVTARWDIRLADVECRYAIGELMPPEPEKKSGGR